MGVCLGDRGNRNPGACGALGLVPCAVVWLVCNLGENNVHMCRGAHLYALTTTTRNWALT